MALRGVIKHVLKSSDPLGQERGAAGKRNSLRCQGSGPEGTRQKVKVVLGAFGT
jgi:hypothetical protein